MSPRALELAREHIVESGTGCKATTMSTGNGIARRSLCSQAGTREKEPRRWMTDNFAGINKSDGRSSKYAFVRFPSSIEMKKKRGRYR